MRLDCRCVKSIFCTKRLSSLVQNHLLGLLARSIMSLTGAEDVHTDISLMQPQRKDDPMTEPVAGIKRPDSPVDARPGPSKPSKNQSPGVNRPRASMLLPSPSFIRASIDFGVLSPAKPPGDLLGPYFHFVSTTPDQRWTGSVLVLHRKGERS